jgi:DNA polymerase-3 subunit delta
VLTVERSFKWGELLAANQALSLFGDKKLIELRIPTGKPGKDGGAAQSYAKISVPDNLTLITLPKLDWATQKAAWVAACSRRPCISTSEGGTGAAARLDGQRLAAQGRAPTGQHRFHRRPRGRQPAGRAPGNQKLGLLHERAS